MASSVTAGIATSMWNWVSKRHRDVPADDERSRAVMIEGGNAEYPQLGISQAAPARREATVSAG
jgi:hypothetical protein